ncbi:dual specificity protein phosphatase family protein, partial [Ascoidea rubescens DSM 1968]
YPNGPICIEPNLYLYSEPTLSQLNQFDVIINVAKEVKTHTRLPEYIYMPWTHTSQLCPDFPQLTKLIESNLNKNLRILIHCQCGVSRSASLVVAYIMKLKNLKFSDAYCFVKEKASEICPNMTLLYELIEW